MAKRPGRQVSNRTAWEESLGVALTNSLVNYLSTNPERITPIERAIAMIGYSDELKRLIVGCITVNPAMEEAFLLIAELAYRDGETSSE